MMLSISQLHFVVQLVRRHVQINAFEDNLHYHFSNECEVGDGMMMFFSLFWSSETFFSNGVSF